MNMGMAVIDVYPYPKLKTFLQELQPEICDKQVNIPYKFPKHSDMQGTEGVGGKNPSWVMVGDGNLLKNVKVG